MVGEDACSLRDSSRRYRTARSSGLRTESQEPMLGNLRPELEILFLACSLRCLPNTRNRSRSWNASRFGVDRMQRNFDPMRKQVEAGQRSELTSLRRLSSTKLLSRAGWKVRNTWLASCMISTSRPSTRSSGRGRSGVSRTRLHLHSRNWIRARSNINDQCC